MKAISLLAAFLLLASSVGLVSDARAQDTPEDPPIAVWHRTLGTQLAEQLSSDDPTVQRDALIHTIHFGRYGDVLHYGEDINLDQTLPTLLDLFTTSDDEQIRVLALAGIHAIGDEDAMSQVRRQIYAEKSPHMLLIELAALLDFYGAKTFDNDRLVAERTKKLVDYFNQPRVEVGPMEVIMPPLDEPSQNGGGQ